MGCIYKLVAPHGKAYIGITMSLPKRLKEHRSLARNGSPFLIHKAIRKYGWPSFDVQVLIEITDIDLLKAGEMAAIREHQTHVSQGGYNLTLGGDGVWHLPVSDETREKLRKAGLGRKASAETRQRMSDAHKGRKNTPEHNANISKAIKGHPSYKKMGKACSDATREKLRQAMIGRKHPTRKKPPAITEEHRQRLREGQQRRRAEEKAENDPSSS